MWTVKHNDSGQRYLTCRRCDQVDYAEGLMPPFVGG